MAYMEFQKNVGAVSTRCDLVNTILESRRYSQLPQSTLQEILRVSDSRSGAWNQIIGVANTPGLSLIITGIRSDLPVQSHQFFKEILVLAKEALRPGFFTLDTNLKPEVSYSTLTSDSKEQLIQWVRLFKTLSFPRRSTDQGVNFLTRLYETLLSICPTLHIFAPGEADALVPTDIVGQYVSPKNAALFCVPDAEGLLANPKTLLVEKLKVYVDPNHELLQASGDDQNQDSTTIKVCEASGNHYAFTLHPSTPENPGTTIADLMRMISNLGCTPTHNPPQTESTVAGATSVTPAQQQEPQQPEVPAESIPPLQAETSAALTPILEYITSKQKFQWWGKNSTKLVAANILKDGISSGNVPTRGMEVLVTELDPQRGTELIALVEQVKNTHGRTEFMIGLQERLNTQYPALGNGQ